MTTIKLSSKNQVVIPKEVRQKMGLKGGDKLVVSKVTKDQVVLKRTLSFHELRGLLKYDGEDATERIRKLRDEWR